MSYGRTSGLLGLLAVLIVVLLCSISGCASKRLPSQSWDQENLKRYDRGCPTAIFIAPHGELVQCQQQFQVFKINQSPPPLFDTIEQAATAGLKAIAIKPTAPFYEWGGKIVQTPGGKFAALPANTSFEGSAVSIRGGFPGMNTVTVGDYHTHPCLPGYYVEYFSSEDMVGSIFYHRVLFMGDFCTGNVHEFKVGDKPDVEHPNPDVSFYLSKGRIIGKFTTPHALTVAE